MSDICSNGSCKRVEGLLNLLLCFSLNGQGQERCNKTRDTFRAIRPHVVSTWESNWNTSCGGRKQTGDEFLTPGVFSYIWQVKEAAIIANKFERKGNLSFLLVTFLLHQLLYICQFTCLKFIVNYCIKHWALCVNSLSFLWAMDNQKPQKTLSRPLHLKLKKIQGLFNELHRNLRTFQGLPPKFKDLFKTVRTLQCCLK